MITYSDVGWKGNATIQKLPAHPPKKK